MDTVNTLLKTKNDAQRQLSGILARSELTLKEAYKCPLASAYPAQFYAVKVRLEGANLTVIFDGYSKLYGGTTDGDGDAISKNAYTIEEISTCVTCLHNVTKKYACETLPECLEYIREAAGRHTLGDLEPASKRTSVDFTPLIDYCRRILDSYEIVYNIKRGGRYA
jgi:hypothetical protein